ncbi:MAG TPA: LPXTG cell wall anchor domain-containing protein [Solirubrobacterales bacterium]|nr:LPXTG cell wall anchor domain-containing protein [Solirubrobacterales bacterium]
MTRLKHVSIAVFATVALAAALASPAGARVVNSSTDPAPPIVFRTHPVTSPAAATPLVTTVEGSESSGFDWGSASIGAATVLGLGVLMSGAVLFNRRRRRPVAVR